MKHLLSALALVFLVCIPVRGKEVVFSFSGTIHELDGEFSFLTGLPFEIVYTFESATNDADPADPESGSYIGAIKSGTLTIYGVNKSYRWVLEPEASDNIIEVKTDGSSDSYVAGATASGRVDGKEIPAYCLVELKDRNATSLGDDGLPVSLKVQSFDDHRIVKLSFVGAREYVYSTIGVITSGSAPVTGSPAR